jgi:hypothetical protein
VVPQRTGYRLPERMFEFVSLWGMAVFFIYARHRVNCKECGVVAEMLPWAEGKYPLTTQFAHFLAYWARNRKYSVVVSTKSVRCFLAVLATVMSIDCVCVPSADPLQFLDFALLPIKSVFKTLDLVSRPLQCVRNIVFDLFKRHTKMVRAKLSKLQTVFL